MSNWSQLDAAEVLHKLGSNAFWGLSSVEASYRLEKYGFQLGKQRYAPPQIYASR